MRKILILTSGFLPEPDANGINVNNITQELINRGYNVTCISYKKSFLPYYDIINGVEIYRIKPSFFTQILENETTRKSNIFIMIAVKAAKILRKIKLGLLLFNFPNFDIVHDYKIYWEIRKLLKKTKYDMILGVYKPYSNISALLKIKRKESDILCGAYYLDLINSIQKPSFIPRKLYEWLCKKSDYKVFKILDFSLVAKAGKNLHSDLKFRSIESKINYVDFPTFYINNEINCILNDDNIENTIELIYAGTLDEYYRNPKYLLDILSKLTQFGININLNIYGRGNCDEILDSYNNNKELRIFNNGFADLSIIRKKMLESDFVINISNEISSAVPSKIFELFSTGKPIINIAANKRDITNSYFEKYPSVFSIDNKCTVESQINEFYSFILRERGKNYSINKIAENFKENTPAYTVDLIEDKFNEFVNKRM
jgi:glycosyltransferase involved in cell wall biosynthesis